MQPLQKNFSLKKAEIRRRLKGFKLLTEEEKFREFLFCLLTPQSNAQRCWQAVLELTKLGKFTHKNVLEILSKKTRFHHTKTKRVLNAEENWKKIKPSISNPDKKQLRDKIADEVNGYGLKESSHFLRNIGLSNNQIAILDRHILKNLRSLNLIKETKIKSKKNYLEVEQIFLNFANSINIPPDELDLLWWSQENGEIFK